MGTFRKPTSSSSYVTPIEIGKEGGVMSMKRLQRLKIPMVASLVVLILLAGCGYSAVGSVGSTGSSPGRTGTNGSKQVTKTAIGLTALPTRTSPTSSPPRSTSGFVTLHIGTIPKSARSTITFTLDNQTTQAISFADHQSECTVILLQMMPQLQENGQWQPLAPCKALTLTRFLTLAAEKSLTLTLSPPNGQWVPGLYRGALSYVSSGAEVPSKTVFAPSFRVGSKALPTTTQP
jgi:hypothetical protein